MMFIISSHSSVNMQKMDLSSGLIQTFRENVILGGEWKFDFKLTGYEAPC